MRDALKIIIKRSSLATKLATETLEAIRIKSPLTMNRYIRTVRTAFSDPTANFTDDERELIASYLDEENDVKTFTVRVRITADEKERLTNMAQDQHMTMSEFIRKKIFS